MADAHYHTLSNVALDEAGPRFSHESGFLARKESTDTPQRFSFAIALPWVLTLALLSLMVFQQTNLRSRECSQDCIWQRYEIGEPTQESQWRLPQVKQF